MIFGVDPSGSYVGLASVVDAEVTGLRSVRCFTGEPERSYWDRIRPAILEMVGDEAVAVWAIEKPPPTAKSSANHGHQAVIGYSVGYISGMIACGSRPWGRVERVEVSPWRASMLIWAARRGLLLSKPPKSPPIVSAARKIQPYTVERYGGTCLAVVWTGCGHQLVFETFTAMQSSLMHWAGCPQCAVVARRGAPSSMTPDEWRRDEWKRMACQVVEKFWPDLYVALVEDAKSRAKTIKPDHRLAGVADACEAACIALHVAPCWPA
tara:strand:+ start:7101 stop:7898 length:798 start_codon:yes stop_codon:yes gene_type:complete